MAGLRNQKQVMGELDRLAGAAMGKAAAGYKRDVLGPVVEAVNGVAVPDDLDAPIEPDQVQGLLSAFGPKTFRRMNSTDLEQRIADALFTSGAIGVVSAMPRQRGNEATRQRGAG